MVEPLETLARREGIFEIHVAGPKMLVEEAEALFTEFQRLGFPKHKYFLAVNNVPSSSVPYAAGTPPVGHDLENPGVMTTLLTPRYDYVKRLVLDAMALLKSHGYQGNFEIERVISERIPDFTDIDIGRDFPGFKAADLAPLYENHFIYKGTQNSLPSHHFIIEFVRGNFGVNPPQIVDFSREPIASPDTIVSRVATVYQESRDNVLRFGNLMQRLSDRSTKTNNPSHYLTLTEQVCLVGEAK